MRSMLSTLLVFILAVCVLTGCASGTAATITPEQAWAGSKVAGHLAGVIYVGTQCKGGQFFGVPCAEATAQLNAAVDTIADDVRPGAVVDPAKRDQTRAAAATQVARALHRADFEATDEGAKDRQASDVALVRPLIDVIGEAIVGALRK